VAASFPSGQLVLIAGLSAILLFGGHMAACQRVWQAACSACPATFACAACRKGCCMVPLLLLWLVLGMILVGIIFFQQVQIARKEARLEQKEVELERKEKHIEFLQRQLWKVTGDYLQLLARGEEYMLASFDQDTDI
jgi:uncharacterized protein HemX